MLRKSFFAVVTVLTTAASSQAAIIITVSPPTPLNGGLVGTTLTAVGTAGEVIDTFSAPMIVPKAGSFGVHNVWQTYTGASTPTTQEQTPGWFDPSWAPYDTYFMYNNSQTSFAGLNFSETNDGTTTGTLGLVQIGGMNTNSGFGIYTSPATASKTLLAPIPATKVPFMHVVMRATDDALLTVTIQANGGAISTQITNFELGSLPEPSSMSLLGLTFAGGFGFIRRR